MNILKYLMQLFWVFWYDYISSTNKYDNITFMNYGYHDSSNLCNNLDVQDIDNKYYIQMYNHVLKNYSIYNKTVLELSSGRGGGAEYLSRIYNPIKYIGIDYSKNAISFCKNKYKTNYPKLDFIHGNVLNLPFDNSSFDVIINVEASHCYNDINKMLLETSRVLKPNGIFLYTDFRPKEYVNEWISNINNSGFKIINMNIINDYVLQGMDENSIKHQMLSYTLPIYLQWFGHIFSGVKNTTMYNLIESNTYLYISFVILNNK